MTVTQWNRQYDAQYDYPATEIRVRYALCTTPRSGSHFFGHQLHARGMFGYPLEYMHPRNIKRWEQRADRAPVLDFIKSIRTSENGCFGIKLHYSHLARFLRHERPEEVLDYRYVLLRRDDLVAQAISYHRAFQTGAWISEMPKAAEASYDFDEIAKALGQISTANANWRAFLTSLGVPFIEVRFEDLRTDPAAAVGQVADFLGIDPTPAAHGFQPERQSSDTEGWAARFINDARARLRTGQPVPGGTRAATQPTGVLRRARGLVKRVVG